MYKNCKLCPNLCGVDRTKSVGICGQSDKVRIAWSGLHRGEEPPLTGEKGSGMIFFTGCPLHCRYCQNHQISGAHGSNMGFMVTESELGELMISLQKQGATTLNLVTGTHFIPSIVNALKSAKSKGFNLPVVWNSSGYENVEALKIIDPYIDLYLMDMKTLDENVAKAFCGRKKYKDVIIPVMDFITSTHPYTDLDKIYGNIVRHLVFPSSLKETIDVLTYYSKHYKDKCFLSLMVQFVPPIDNPGFKKISEDEYDFLLDSLDMLKIEEGFVQEIGDEILWIPDFNKDIPFPTSFADPNPYFLQLKRKSINQ